MNITHGPIGCGFYSWLTRRNQTDASADGAENYMTYCFSTDMQDKDIIFGGEKKLELAIQEAYDLFHPKGIAIFATCPVGLIGDDIHAVAAKMKKKLGDCNVFAFSCEGYKGVSQSAGTTSPTTRCSAIWWVRRTTANRANTRSAFWASTTSAATGSRSTAF